MRRRTVSVVALLLAFSASCAWTARLNVDDAGNQATGGASGGIVLSESGRYAAYESAATSLVPGDTNATTDVFLHDALLGTTIRVSVDSTGDQATGGASTEASISDDGRFVAFTSAATNLVAGDTNGVTDVFRHDTLTGTTTRVSVDSAGSQATGDSTQPAISGDGRHVAFRSAAPDLVADDTNGTADIFLHDTQTGATTRISVDSAGNQATGDSMEPAMSEERFVVFASSAADLVGDDTNGTADIFLHDTQTGATTRISVDSAGDQATGGDSTQPAISDDGRHLAFTSLATDLVPGDANGVADVFVHDTLTSSTMRASVDSLGAAVSGASFEPTISDDGRFVAFASDAPDLIATDTNGTTDVFLRDLDAMTTLRMSESFFWAGESIGGATVGPALSDDGRYLAFETDAHNLVPNDTNGVRDVLGRYTIVPDPTGVFPATADRDEAVSVRVTGTDLDGVTEAFVGGGVSVLGVTPISPSEIDLQLSVAPDAPLGPRTITLINHGALGLYTGAAGDCTDCFVVTNPWSVVDPSPDIQSIHAALLPTGKVLIIEGDGWDQTQHAAGLFRAGVWDPTDNSFTEIITPIDLFCAGHAQLPDGTLLISGGTQLWEPGALEGAPDAFLFNPWTEAFELIDAGVVGRWYPTVINLDDGTALTIGGLDEHGVATNTYEIWDPATGDFGPVGTFPGSSIAAPLYPALHLLEHDHTGDTRLFHSGMWAVGGSPDVVPGIWNVDADTYTPVPGLRDTAWLDQGASIMLPPAQDQTVMVVGGGDLGVIATDRVDIVDLSVASPSFVPGPSISEPKMFVLAAILPDRTVIQAGGMDRHISGWNQQFHAAIQPRFSVQTYDPTTGAWTDRPPTSIERAYHSEMVLLDDGRVALLGGQRQQGPGERDIELLEPWYYDEPRPTIDTAPAAISYGAAFPITVTPTTGTTIDHVQLVKPNTPTHSLDPGHRLVDLDFTVAGSTVTVTPAFGPDLAPAGYYMLNVVDSDGIPSVSAWVQLG